MSEHDIRSDADVACTNTLDHLRAGKWSAESVNRDIEQGNAPMRVVAGMALALAIYLAE